MEKRKESTIWKPISIGGTSAVVFVMGSSLLGAGEDAASHGITIQPTAEDEESFGQAFAEARAQKGPHASFEWHGNQYSTATQEEWESLTVDQQEEIVAHVEMPAPVEEAVQAEAVEVVETPEIVDVTEDLDVSVMDEDVAEADVSVLDESSDDDPQPLVAAVDEDDFGDDDVRVIGYDGPLDDDSYVALGDGGQDIYVVDLDDVAVSDEDEKPSEEVDGVDVDVNIDRQIDLSREIDYEEPQPEDDGLMGESVDSYFA